MIKAIILDCFGVLVGRGFEETYRTAGGDPEADRDFIDDILGQTNLGLINQAEFNSSMAAKLGISEAQWQDTLDKVERPNMELLDYAKSLRKDYKLAVLSNANRGLIEYIESIGGENCFDEVIVSAEVGMIKPNSEIYEYTAEKLGVKPDECIFIDDREVHLAGAETVGMQTILYKDFAQTKAELDKLLVSSQT